MSATLHEITVRIDGELYYPKEELIVFQSPEKYIIRQFNFTSEGIIGDLFLQSDTVGESEDTFSSTYSELLDSEEIL